MAANVPIQHCVSVFRLATQPLQPGPDFNVPRLLVAKHALQTGGCGKSGRKVEGTSEKCQLGRPVPGTRTTNGFVTVAEQHLVHHVVLRRGGTAGQIAAFGKQRQIMQQQCGGSWKKIFGGGKSEHVFMFS